MQKPPSQPDPTSWHFVQELKSPLIHRVRWSRTSLKENEADLRAGVRLAWNFPDPEGLLLTARQDLERFLKGTRLSLKGSYEIRFILEKVGKPESYLLRIASGCCDLVAGDLEGMRRAIYCLEEQLLASDGPFLRLGKILRRPVIKARISRCFFGPIKRPPKNRDELADEENYYPDEYLSRLARNGVNGLWLTASFHELCPSRFFPDFGRDSERRLRKLRDTVRQCARYGIGIYVFCIEPRGFGDNPEYLHSLSDLKRHPELEGHKEGAFTFFCTSTPTGQNYLEEATGFLFSQVPGLAGMITINMGERPTHCYSNMLWDTGPNNCKRCSQRKPSEVFHDTLAAMKRGMNKTNPNARLISWLYVPTVLERKNHSIGDFHDEMVEIAAGFPRDVVFQYNFESMGTTAQLGRSRLVRDYSLAYVGPSRVFSDCARNATRNGISVSAKLQVGCSHEVATVPVVPVPGNLFRKYRAMHRLGVSAAMQCWYFGNYPSIMTQAAGRLSFSPLPHSEREFFLELARPQWGGDAPLVAEAWEYFGAAYRQFPASVNFAWYGPVHDAIAWPLYLKPIDLGMAPSWLLGFPPSGDRIGECIGFGHSLGEILTLCERMTDLWQRGMKCLKSIPWKRRQGELAKEIGLAEAMSLQLQSAFHVIKFYAWRETLIGTEPGDLQKRLQLLRCLKDLVRKEIANSRRMTGICRKDSRLGFHSEAEGYKYFPELLEWREKKLKELLTDDFVEIEKDVRAGRSLFPAYSGARMKKKMFCTKPSRDSDESAWSDGHWEECPAEGDVGSGWRTRFKVERGPSCLTFRVTCDVPSKVLQRRKPVAPFAGDHVIALVEPRRLWPARELFVGVAGERFDIVGREPGQPKWESEVGMTASGWRVLIRIPFALLGEMALNMRVNLIRITPETGVFSWIKTHPGKNRLLFGNRNPRDLGWLVKREN